MPNLYELTGQRLALQQKLEVLNFDEETILDTLEGESTELQDKIEDYGYVIRNRSSLVDAMNAEIERMTERRNAELKRVENIKSWLLENMQRCSITKIECPVFTITVQVNPASVEVLDEAQIPEAYMRQPEIKIPPKQADKKLIATALKSGLEVSGCALKQSNRLVIK